MRLLLASSTLIALVGFAAATTACFNSSSSADDSSGDDSTDSGKRDAKGGGDDTEADAGEDDAEAEASAPVSLSKDLMPKLQLACGLSSSCHQSSTGKQIWLGGKSTPIPAATLYANLKKKSVELPTMPYVTASNPAKSYIVYKLEAHSPTDPADDLAGLTCPKNAIQQPPDEPCGLGMPQDSSPWEFADLFRSWVEQGAKNN